MTTHTLDADSFPRPSVERWRGVSPGDGQMLLRNEYLSLDPYMRGRMSDAPSYAEPVALGAVMVGGTVSQVVSSDVAGFAEGDWVVAFGGWQDYALLASLANCQCRLPPHRVGMFAPSGLTVLYVSAAGDFVGWVFEHYGGRLALCS